MVVSLTVHVFCNIFFGRYVEKKENVEKFSYLRCDCIMVSVFYHVEAECLSPYSDWL
jgi:hypothetical protein